MQNPALYNFIEKGSGFYEVFQGSSSIEHLRMPAKI